MKSSYLLASVAYWLSFSSSFTLTAGEYAAGTVHDKLIDLDDDSFQTAIEDTANPLWFLKFYAPWCGHCKQMAPVLESVAPKLKGKIAIGKIDCTKHKKVCNEQKVKGFPTLKYSIDGEIVDYSGGRKETDIIHFAEKMSEPPVVEIRRLEEAKLYSRKTAKEGIVFLGSGKKTSDLFNVFKKVARKMQASAYFLWLEQLESPTDDGRDHSYIERIENGFLEPKRWETTEDGLTEENFAAWVKDQNIPTISMLTRENFSRISRNGRPLLMGVVDTENEELVAAYKRHILEFILKAPTEYVDERYYGIFDGKKWQKFLKQFGVKPEENPQFLILAPLDQPGEKTYWRNETYTTLTSFLKAVVDGDIPPRSPEKAKFTDDPFAWMTRKFQQFFPFSMIPLIALVGLIIWAMTPSIDEYEEEDDLDEDEKSAEESKKEK